MDRESFFGSPSRRNGAPSEITIPDSFSSNIYQKETWSLEA